MAPTVLIVDGNEGVQTRIHAWLLGAGVQHTQVFDGEHAVSACAQFSYDVIFMDLDTNWRGQVPSGVDAARHIRLQGLNTLTPIVACSGQERESLPDWAAAGMNELLTKPFNKTNVLQCIQKWTVQGVVVEPLSVSDIPALVIDDLAPPDFLVAQSVRPKTARVLVVEDCSLTQHVICSLLKNLTDHVTQAFDGEQAIMLCSQTAFDVIFMDIHMPKISGLQATQHLRNTSNLNVYTPIIAFTASGSLQEYSAYGVNDMLAKPFTTESLSDIFDKWTPYSKSMMDVTKDLSFSPAPAVSSEGPHITSLGENLVNLGMTDGAMPLPLLFSDPPSSAPTPPAQDGFNAAPIPVIQKLNLPASSLSAASGKFKRSESAPGGRPGKKKKQNALGHTAKEKLRRANIVNSCNEFRTMVPTIQDSDKATVFRTSVDYLRFLRSSIAPEELEKLDARFVEMLELRSVDQSSKLSLSPQPSPQMPNRSSPASS